MHLLCREAELENENTRFNLPSLQFVRMVVMYSVCFTINILSLSTTNTLTLSSISFISTTLIPISSKMYAN